MAGLSAGPWGDQRGTVRDGQGAPAARRRCSSPTPTRLHPRQHFHLHKVRRFLVSARQWADPATQAVQRRRGGVRGERRSASVLDMPTMWVPLDHQRRRRRTRHAVLCRRVFDPASPTPSQRRCDRGDEGHDRRRHPPRDHPPGRRDAATGYPASSTSSSTPARTGTHRLNGIFFEEMGPRLPDHVLDVDVSSLSATLGDILRKTEAVLAESCLTPSSCSATPTPHWRSWPSG